MAALSFASPTRVLDRIKRMEEAELPSLPSIQPNFDNDSVATSEGYTEQGEMDSVDATHQPRYAQPVPGDTSSTSTSTTSSAPFPPLPSRASSSSTTPYYSRRTGTSTPFARRMVSDDHATPATARYLGHSRNSSDTRYSSPQFHTPGEMSGSFGAEPIPAAPVAAGSDGEQEMEMESEPEQEGERDEDEEEEMPSLPDAMDYSTPLNDSTSSHGSIPAETPLRRFSRNVVVDRPGRKSQSLLPTATIPSPASQSPMSLPQPTPAQRVPSLTSEISTDTSHAATTPEAPPRHAPVATPSFSRSLHEDHSLEIIEHPSPAPTTVYSTPGMAREPAQAPPEESAYRLEGLSDMTDRFRRSLNTPFTPSPLAKDVDLATPRAPLNDSERRKSHVLAVLQSTQPRQRTPYPRGQGTPGTPFSAATPRAMDRSSSAPNESILSIASSADLTTDRRAVTHSRISLSRGNTSFPNMLLGNTSTTSQISPASTDRRADGIKIHKHLNAMNRQLLETNADLAREAEGWKEEAGRLKGLLKDAGVEVDDVEVSFVAKSRENSFADADDSRVEQDSAQRMVASYSPEQNAAIMQKLAEEMEELQEMLSQKDEQIVALQDELAELTGQGEQDQKAELLELQQRVDQAEQERANLHTSFASQTAEHARQFAEISAAFEQQAQELQGELADAKEELKRLREELAQREHAQSGVGDASGEGDSSRAAELEQQVRDLQDEVDARGQELEELENKYAESADLAAELEKRLGDAELEARQAGEREQEHAQQNADLEAQVQSLQADLDAHIADIDSLQSTVVTLNATVEERDSEITSLQGRLEVAELAAQPLRQSIASTGTRDDERASNTDKSQAEAQAQASFVAAMEERLDEAYREIGRLKHELTASPQRKATMDAKDAKIAALEREKATLLARQKGPTTPLRLATSNSAGMAAGTGAGTGAGEGSPLGRNGRPTPLFNRALQHLQTPRTPGSMKELSWLNSTVGDANEPILRAQVDYLQTELEKVNGQLDSNFSRLEEAGLGSVALAEKLAAALAKIGELEDEIRALLIKDKSGMLDAQQATGERLQNALAKVHEQLDALRLDSTRERSRLSADIADLKKALNDQIDTAEREVERMRLETIDALDAAHGNVEKAKEDAIASTRETAAVRAELEGVQRQVRTLERDLERAKKECDGLRRQQVDSVPSWEVQSKEGTIKRLQADLDALKAEADSTASRLAQHTSKAQSDLAAAQARADHLSRQLVQQTASAQTALTEVKTLKDERARVMREIEAFDADLALQTVEAKRLKEQLIALRDNQEKREDEVERAKGEVKRVRGELEGLLREREREKGEESEEKEEVKSMREEVKRLERALERAEGEVRGWERWREGHACGGDTEKALQEQRARFKASTRDLAAQIRYLKAKYTRESTFRNGLGLQKRYLLLLVGGMSLNEQATLKAIAQMGYPVPEPPRKQRTFKAVGIAVLSTIRARNAAASWRSEKEAKERALSSFSERRR